MSVTSTSPVPLPGPAVSRRWWTLAVLCMSLLITVLDTTIVNVALPTLDRELGASASGLEWIVDAYTVTFAGLLLLAGAAGDRYGRHHALAIGLIVLGAGSAMAAISASATALIVARTVMGAGAALIMPATLSILSGVFPKPHERAKAIGLWSAVSGVGVAFGPTLGGLLLEHFAWNAIFLINLPLIAAALLAGHVLVPASRAPRPRRIDLPGGVLSVAGVGALTYTLIQAPSAGWTSSTTLAAAVVSATLLAVFGWWQNRTDAPLVELALFRDRRFAGASMSVTALFFALTAATFVLTQIYQFVLGYSPLAAGLRALPPALAVMLVSPVGSHLAVRVGARPPVVAGLLTATAGLCLYATAGDESGYAHYMIAMVIVGTGIGLAMAPATQTIMTAVPPAKAGVGSAINDTTRNLGNVLGIAVVGSVVTSLYQSGLAGATEHLPSGAARVVTESVGGANALADRLPGDAGSRLVAEAHHAFVHAADRGMLVAAAVTLLAAGYAVRRLRSPIADRTVATGQPVPAVATGSASREPAGAA